MGWLYTYGGSRSSVIAERCAPREWDNNGKKVRVVTLHKALRGNCLWLVLECSIDGVAHCRGIELNLLGTGGRRREAGDDYGWGYKDIDETMGPVEVSCPEKFLELVPCPPGEYAARWRERVRQHHQRRRERAAASRALRARARSQL